MMRSVLDRRPWPARIVALGMLLLCPGSADLGAQEGAGASVAGRVADARSKPVRFATVWLVPADTTVANAVTLTDAAGDFAFPGLKPGRYYLRVDRVGFSSEWSEAKTVVGGQRLKLAVTSAPAPIRLAPVTAAGSCRWGDQIAADTVLAKLWREARKSAFARRLFDRSYSYDVQVKEQLRMTEYLYRATRKARHRLTSTPAQARALEARGATAGYGVGMDSTRLVSIQEMLQLLAEATPRSHCLMALPDADGLRRVHLRPLNDTATYLVTAANIVLDRKYRLRRIEFEYRMRNVSRARGYAEFGEAGPKGSGVPVLKKLVAWVSVAFETRPEGLGAGPSWSLRFGVERAAASVKYRNFQRDTAAN